MCLVHQVLPTAQGLPGWSPIQVLTRSTVLDFGDLTGTGMSPPLGRRQVPLPPKNRRYCVGHQIPPSTAQSCCCAGVRRDTIVRLTKTGRTNSRVARHPQFFAHVPSYGVNQCSMNLRAKDRVRKGVKGKGWRSRLSMNTFWHTAIITITHVGSLFGSHACLLVPRSSSPTRTTTPTT